MSLLLNGKSNGNIYPINITQNGVIVSNYNYYRNNEKLFTLAVDGTSSAATYGLLSIWNPTNSQKKLGIYNINVELSSSGSSIWVLRYELWSLTSQPTGGSVFNAYNMKLGASNGTLEYRKGLTSGYTGVNMIYASQIYSSSSTSDVDKNITNSNFQEILEILPGNGIIIKIINSTTSSFTYTGNVKFIETSVTDVI